MNKQERLDWLCKTRQRCRVVTEDHGFAFGPLVYDKDTEWRLMRFKFYTMDVNSIEQDEDVDIWVIRLARKAELYL